MGFALTEDNEDTPERYRYENNVEFNWKIYIKYVFNSENLLESYNIINFDKKKKLLKTRDFLSKQTCKNFKIDSWKNEVS